MGCPLCPTAGWLGGYLGGYFGIKSPSNLKARVLSAAITATLLSITTIALKLLFNISLCGGASFTATNMIPLLLKMIPLGVIYSIGVNYIINHYVSPPTSETKEKQSHSSKEEEHECCKARK